MLLPSQLTSSTSLVKTVESLITQKVGESPLSLTIYQSSLPLRELIHQCMMWKGMSSAVMGLNVDLLCSVKVKATSSAQSNVSASWDLCTTQAGKNVNHRAGQGIFSQVEFALNHMKLISISLHCSVNDSLISHINLNLDIVANFMNVWYWRQTHYIAAQRNACHLAKSHNISATALDPTM